MIVLEAGLEQYYKSVCRDRKSDLCIESLLLVLDLHLHAVTEIARKWVQWVFGKKARQEGNIEVRSGIAFHVRKETQMLTGDRNEL